MGGIIYAIMYDAGWEQSVPAPAAAPAFMPCISGCQIYVERCNAVMNNRYEGFMIDRAAADRLPTGSRSTGRQLDIAALPPAVIA